MAPVTSHNEALLHDSRSDAPMVSRVYRAMKRILTIVATVSLVWGTGVSCYEDDPGAPNENGLTRVLLTDAPFPYDSVASVDVYVSRIEASAAFDTAGPGDWTLITAPRRRFNLLALQQGTTALLGEGEMEAGAYRAVRMVINTDSSAIRWSNGSAAAVDWQNYTGIEELPLHALVEAAVPVEPTSGRQVSAEIVLDFDVGRSFLFDFFGTREFTFLPWIRAVDARITGAIEGFVTTAHTGVSAPVRNANVTVYRADSLLAPELRTIAATGRSDANGHYRVAFLHAGRYLVRIEQPELPFLAADETAGIEVRAGQTATHAVSLPEAGASGAYIQVSGPSSVGVGGTIVLRAAVGDGNGNVVSNPSITWSVRDTGVVALSDSVTVAWATGIRPGSVAIIATSDALSDTVRVQVIGSTAPVATITVSPAARTLSASDSLTSYGSFTATLRDSLGNQLVGRPITWFTADTAVAQVVQAYDATAWVRGMRSGSTTVRATSEGKTGQGSVTVTP